MSDGNPEHGSILLAFLDGAPVLILADHADSNKSKIEINLDVQNKAAAFRLINRYSNDGSHIGVVAGRNESAIMTMMSGNIEALNLLTGTNGAQINLENEVVNFKPRKR